MPQQNHPHADLLQTRFGTKAAAYLNAGCNELSPAVAERLRAARMQAVGQRRVKALPQSHTQTLIGWLAWLGSVRQPAAQSSHGSGNDGDENPNWWSSIANVLPLVILVVGLFAISMVQQDNRAQEIAEVDAALLTDALPPSAFADAGFVQFLKANH